MTVVHRCFEEITRTYLLWPLTQHLGEALEHLDPVRFNIEVIPEYSSDKLSGNTELCTTSVN